MGISAYAIWGGVIPLYLKALHPLTAPSILALRILWSLIFLVLLAIAARSRTIFDVLRQPRMIGALVVTSMLIGANWLIYIYMINAGHVLQASLGYFINPLLNVLLGVVILRERLGRAEAAALLLAAIGVAAYAIWQQTMPILPLSLACTFGLYGLVRKMIPVEALDGLLIETAILAPFALGWLLTHGGFDLPASGPSLPLVAASGIVTAAPLLLFNAAARHVRYADLALMQYLSPTLQLLAAVLVFGEPLLPIHLIAFAFIWTGLLIYATVNWRRGRATLPTPPE